MIPIYDMTRPKSCFPTFRYIYPQKLLVDFREFLINYHTSMHNAFNKINFDIINF